jgi:phospholipid/cholesterol/gamma-HCH transport system ATP-binding protein
MNEPGCKIEFRDVSFSYDDNIVLGGVSFCVRSGELIGILGPSGAGKSTILKLVVGLLKPDAGKILVGGQDITQLGEERLNEVRRHIGFVFQDGALFSGLTVYENVAYRPRELGWDEARIDREVKRVLDFVGLLDVADELPDKLSGGMNHRVAIARGLVDQPEILLLDEPTAALDPPTARLICEMMIKLRDVHGITSMFVTHMLEDVRYVSSKYYEAVPGGQPHLRGEDNQLCLINTKFLMLEQQKIIFEGAGEQLWTSSDPRVKYFVSDDDQALAAESE